MDRRRVLVVDDVEDLVVTLTSLIELLGHEVRGTTDARAAPALAERFQPDLALLDISMPGLSGWELAMQLRAQPGGSRIHLVALTGLGEPDDFRRSMQAGFDEHWVKPLDVVKLSSALSRDFRAP